MDKSAHVDTFCRDNLPPPEQRPPLKFELPELQYPEILNCARALVDANVEQGGGDRSCLRSDDVDWSYGQTLELVNQISHVLRGDLGVVPGNRVLLRGPNSPWLAAALLAVMKAGAVAVPTMPQLRVGELRTIIDKAQVGTALCDHRFVDDLERADAGIQIVPFGANDAGDLTHRATSRPTAFDGIPTFADDVCLIAFTSGTTGQPKGCLRFHRDMLVVGDTFSRHIIKPTPGDVFTGSPSLAFMYGLGQNLMFPLRAGATALLIEQGSPPALVDAISRHRPTVCATAPTAYRRLHELDGDLSSLRRCVSAGEPLPASTWHDFHDLTGLTIIDGIGTTELFHIFISASDNNIRPGATGLPVPGYEVAVIDNETGIPVADGTVGHLAVRGPTGCNYLADARQTKYVRHSWNVTGDAYLRDEDGYFWFQARLDDMIISSGYNIAGPEVEAALLTHPGVAEAGVVGAPDGARGQVVAAYVVLRDGFTPDAETATALQNHVKATIAPYKYPRLVQFVDELPKTKTGKLQRYRLRELAETE